MNTKAFCILHYSFILRSNFHNMLGMSQASRVTANETGADKKKLPVLLH
jgi:hypothetical protein